MKKLLFLLILLSLISEYALSASINVDYIRLTPATLPTTCVTGELRIDSGDSNKLSVCKVGVWVDLLDANAFFNPMTTNGDLITQAAGVPDRLGIGSSGTVLKSNGSAPSWGQVVNADIDAAAAIADTKLATISTSGKVSNSATTATDANTVSAIVARDVSGNFSAGTITAALAGNSSTATALAANPSDCGADTYATTIAASGNLTCSTVTNAGLAGSIAVNKIVAQTVSRALVTDGSGFMTPATTTATEIGYVNGVTSAIQTQINLKAPLASPTFTGTVTAPLTTAGPVLTSSGGVLSSTALLATAQGGSNKNLTVVNGGVVWTDADSMEVSAAGTSGQYLKSNGTSAPAFTTFAVPVPQRFTSSGTYTPTAGTLYTICECWGAGGGGGGSGTTTTGGAGGNGGSTTVGSLMTCAGGSGGGATSSGSSTGGTGGAFSSSGVTVIDSMTGGKGGNGQYNAGGTDYLSGGDPGLSFGGAGCGGLSGAGTAGTPTANSGCGGSGARAVNAAVTSGSGGGGGAYGKALISAPTAQTITINAAGTAGSAGTSGSAGIVAATGRVVCVDHFQ